MPLGQTGDHQHHHFVFKTELLKITKQKRALNLGEWEADVRWYTTSCTADGLLEVPRRTLLHLVADSKGW